MPMVVWILLKGLGNNLLKYNFTFGQSQVEDPGQ